MHPKADAPRVVLLTVDGSDKDERAVAVGAALTQLAAAQARVLHVFEERPAMLTSQAAVFGGVDTAMLRRADAVTHTRQVAAKLGALLHREVMSEVVDGADVAAAILADIRSRDVDFVVMATRAAGVVGRAIEGSVADRLVRESPRPVVLVPPGARYLGGKTVTVRRVLIPLDGSDAALRVIDHLLALPLAFEMEFVLVQAVDPNASEGMQAAAATAATAARRLGDIADRLRSHGSQADVRVVESADPGAAIVDIVRSEFVELIAMSTRGSSGLRRIVLGSVAEQVVRHSEIPVLLVTARSGAAVPAAV